MKSHGITIALALALAAACATTATAEPSGPTSRAPDLQPAIALTSDDLTHFTAALEELRKSGLARANDTSELGKSARAWAANDDALKVLQQHDLSPERFEQIAYSVGMSMAALDIRDRQAEIDAARAKQEQALAQMKAQITPEQYELIQQQFDAANATLDRVRDQPEQNLRLVAEHRQAIEKAIAD